MMIDVIGVRPLGSYKLEIEFSDGTVGVRDFGSVTAKSGPMAEPLKDPAYFARVFIEDGALTWPNASTTRSAARIRFAATRSSIKASRLDMVLLIAINLHVGFYSRKVWRMRSRFTSEI